MRPEDLQFGELAVAQGLCTRAQVDECLALIERLSAEGVTPLPRLGELLARKGYLTPSAGEATARPPSSSGAATRVREAALPPEAREAARDPARAVGKYLKVSRLGAGGMGEVWKAWDPELARWVALKFMRNDDPGEQARFLREAQTAAALNHPNIAAVYESGQSGGKPFLAMQFVDGPTLAAVPRNDPRRLAALVRDAALAVQHAHEKSVIHRDLKPSNLMVEGSRVFVMDFGLAKQTSVDSSLSVSGAILGTPAYMAPEQARGETARVGPRTDVYALGATLYELLSDRPPFQDTEVYALLKRVVEEDPVPLRRRAPRADRDLETVVMKCLEKDPERRYASARELAEDLDRYLEGKAILAHPPSAFYKIRKFAARRKAVLALGAAAVLTVAVLLPVWLRERAERRILTELAELRGQVLLVQEWVRQPFRKPQEIRDALAERVRALSRFIEAHPDFPQGYAVRAQAQLLQGRRRAAEQDLREAIRLEPGFSPAWMLLARAKYEEYEEIRSGGFSEQARNAHRAAARPVLDEARAALDRGRRGDAGLDRWGLARTDDDLVSRTLMRMLVEHHLENRPDQARRTLLDAQNVAPHEELCRWLALLSPDRAEKDRWLDQAVRMAPHSEVGWAARGLDRLDRNLFDDALADLDAALAIDPESVHALLNRAIALVRKGEGARALADCARALSIEPRSSHARATSAAVRLRLNDLEGAARDASEAIRLDSASPLGWINRSAVRLRTGDLDGAAADTAEAIRRDPDVALAYANRAAALLEKGALEGARADVEKALALDSSASAALVTRAALKLLDRDWAGAEADASRAIELDPGEFMAHTNRSAARAERGDLEGASADASRAIELHPRGALAWSNRGFARLRKTDLDGALADLTKAIELDDRLALAYVNRSTVWILKDDHDRALADASRAVELKPGLATAWAARAEARRWKGEFDGSLADAEKAVLLDPRPLEHLLVRGLAYGNVKRYDRAVADLEEVLRRAPPDWPLRAQAQAWLEEARAKRN
jgi:tetratricopeptide (TPR) repeat protein/predicted Ser/Thr protein kinase